MKFFKKRSVAWAVLVLAVAHNMVTGQPEMVNPFTHLTITAIVYFCTLMYCRRKHGG